MTDIANLAPRKVVDILAGRAWPADDLAKRARKTNAVLARAMVTNDLDHLTGADVAAIEQVFARIEVGDLEAWNRGDGTYEMRRVLFRERRPKRKGRRR